MPLPLILGAVAAIAGVTGVGSGIHGAVKMKDANDTMKLADLRHQRHIERFTRENEMTTRTMDTLGKMELQILSSFETYSNLMEKIQNRPEFEHYQKDDVDIPRYDGEQLKKVSIGAGVLLGGLEGAALGTAGGFAASGATTAAVMALGTASTGTAIASLSGAAATNATLAALGGGALAAGGGGMALGSTILGATTLGVGLLVGGVIFNFAGLRLSNKADDAWEQMRRAEAKINQVCDYLGRLDAVARTYQRTLDSVFKIYQPHLKAMEHMVNDQRKTDWEKFTPQEKLCVENTDLLVRLLYSMCKVQLVKKANAQEEMNTVNQAEIDLAAKNAEQFLPTCDVTLKV